MATPINYREVFGSQTLDNLASGSYNYISRRGREQEVKKIPARKGEYSNKMCGAAKISPRLGAEGLASTMFVMGHKVLEGLDLELPRASQIVYSVFNDGNQEKKYEEMEVTLAGTLIKELAQFSLDGKFSRALREQYAQQLINKGFGDDGDDKDLDEDLRTRLRGDAKAHAARKAKDAMRPFTFVFAEIFEEMEVEWKLRAHRYVEDSKKRALEEFNAKEEANRRKAVGGLLAGLGVASMDKDGGGRKTPAPEPVLSAEETAQLSGLMSGNGLQAKPARNKATARAARPSVDKAL